MAIDEQQDYPAHGVGQEIGDSLDKTRERFAWLASMIVANGIVLLPNWTGTAYSTSSPLDYSQPDYWILTADGDNREIRIDLTWSSNQVTGIVISYNAGVDSPGMATVVGGTFTITYDGSGNVTGYTTA